MHTDTAQHLQLVCLMAGVTDIFRTPSEVQLLLSESGFCPVRQRRVSFRLHVTQSNSPLRYRPVASIHFPLFIPSSGKGLNPVATVTRKRASCLWKVQHLTYVFQSLSIQSTSSFSAAPNSCVTIKTTGSLCFTGHSLVRKSIWSLTFFCIQFQDVYHHLTRYRSDTIAKANITVHKHGRCCQRSVGWIF